MPPEKHEDMTKETVCDDVIVFNFGEVIDSKEYLKNVTESQNGIISNDCEGKEQLKQFVADTIMGEIDFLHDQAEEYRKSYVGELVPENRINALT